MADNTAQDIYDRILDAEKVFRPYNEFCDAVDRIYSDKDMLSVSLESMGFTDDAYDTFWASMEVLKPAIYARTPNVVAKPRFSDANATVKLTSELMERVLNSEFERAHLHEHMLMVRDDLALTNRGVLWVTHQDDDGNATCSEWLDRGDFAHEPARSWPDVSWVTRRAWMTLEEMKERFRPTSGDAYLKAFFGPPSDGFASSESMNGYDDGIPDKVAVWEVWDKSDGRVYWVTEGVEEFLDEAEPWIKLRSFFPCPRPAYGTLARRTLIPIPDYRRYEYHLNQINKITRRIYDLLDEVRMRGLIAGGGDVAQSVEKAMREVDASSILIPVSGNNLIQGSSGISSLVQWVPLTELAQAIQGLIEARNQLFADFDRLSGISDIMRGETEASETLGAQRLKSQYGSVRVKDKKDELIRISRDAARIAGEIICETFTQNELLETAQMEIPTRREVEKSIKELEKAARKEMEELTEGVEDAQPQDEEQAAQIEQQFQQAQQQIEQKYGPQLQQLSNTVVIEDVMQLIRDERGRALIIDIENDSTVMTDELAEKQVRGEFLTGFSNALMAVQPLMGAGESGAKMAGAMLKFALEPFNVSRDMAATIDEFVENAPEIAAAMAGAQDEGGGLADAQMALAEAEMAKVQSQTEANQANAQLKMQELELKAAEAQQKAGQDQQKFQLSVQEAEGSIAETMARIEKIYAEIQLAQQKLELDAHKEQREDVKAAADIQGREQDRAMQAQREATDVALRVQDNERAAIDDQHPEARR